MYEATYFNGLQERQMKSIKEIYRIGRGPSSSHTMGPESAAKMFINEFPSADRYEAVLYGSLQRQEKVTARTEFCARLSRHACST